MITSLVATPSIVADASSQEWPHAQSQTEPVIEDPNCLHTARLSEDAPPRHLVVERDISSASTPPSKKHKRKRRSTTLNSIPTRKNLSRELSGLPKSPSVPTFHSRPESRESRSTLAGPTTESLPATPATPLLRMPSNASTADSRSPSQRRAPASHSSYGVETSNGPPPSFTTQRTLSQDRLWKPAAPEKLSAAPTLPAVSTPEDFESQPMPMADIEMISDVSSSQEDVDDTITPTKEIHGLVDGRVLDAGGLKKSNGPETCPNEGQPLQSSEALSADEEGKASGSDDRNSEDLFLNIAQSDGDAQQSLLRSERRKSRVGTLYNSFLGRSTTEQRDEATSSLAQDNSKQERSLSRTEMLYPPTKRHSMAPRTAVASAHPQDENGRHRYFSSGTRNRTSSAQSKVGRGERGTSPDSPYPSSQRGSNLDSGPRSVRHSNLTAFRVERNGLSLEANERLRYVDHNATRYEGTESTISTTAPSTVWDELDELKSRIRKLEKTGKLPSSSAAAMSSVERPRTATTTVTTMSSSPNHVKAGTSPVDSAINGVPASIHPLLHEALRKAKPAMTADIYQKLEATASDALLLASVLTAGLQPGNASVVGGSSSSERQLRRRADSTCRGLTELTIALSAQSTSPPSLQPCRPSSRQASSTFVHTPPTTRYNLDSASRSSRRLSNDPEEVRQPALPRAHSRLENRRASLLHTSMLSTPQDHASSELVVHSAPTAQSQVQMQPNAYSRSNRAATRLRNHREVDHADESENDNSPSVRPVSRARTEVSLRHRSARDRTSLAREYTSSHPLPSFVRRGDDSATQGSSPVLASSGLSTRRAYISPSVNGRGSSLGSPATPSVQPGYRRYVSTSAGRDPSVYLSSTEYTPENVTVARGNASGSRRSLGITSKLGQVGSFVNGRLRGAKAERERHETLPEQHRSPMSIVANQYAGEDRENEGVY